MSKWQMVKLGEVCEPKIETIKSSYDSDMYYIDISSIDNELKEIISYQKINGQNAPSRAKQILKVNDILVSTVRPNLNAVAINKIDDDVDVIASTGYCVLRCSEELLPQYLFSYCKTTDFIDGLVKVAKGASYPAVNNSDVKNSKIPLPPLEEQQKIAKNLDLASDLVKLYKTKLSELDKLIQSVFYDMFGDPVTNEKGWEVSELQEMVSDDCTISYGIVQTGDNQNDGVPVFRPVDIVNKIPKLADLKKTTTEISNKYKKTILKGNELLITVRANIADTYIIDKQFENCNVGRGIVPIRVKENIIVLKYLKYLIDNKSLNRHIKSLAKGITLIQLNMSDLRAVNIILPPLPLQQKFADIVTKIEAQKAEVNKALQDAEMLYNSLMQEYFE